MKCLSCGAEMAVSVENAPYDSCGLPNVILHDIEVRRCYECGDKEISIPDVEGLHCALAKCIVESRPRLTPAEIRYLRRYLGLTGVKLAEQMGVTAETISHWENGQPMGGPSERLLRLMVANAKALNEPTDWLAKVAQEEPRSSSIGVGLRGQLWIAEPSYV